MDNFTMHFCYSCAIRTIAVAAKCILQHMQRRVYEFLERHLRVPSLVNIYTYNASLSCELFERHPDKHTQTHASDLCCFLFAGLLHDVLKQNNAERNNEWSGAVEVRAYAEYCTFNYFPLSYLDFALSPLAMNWHSDRTYMYLLFVRGTTYSSMFSKNRPPGMNGWIKILIVLGVRFHPLQLHRTRHVISIFSSAWSVRWRSGGGEIIDVAGLLNAISIFETFSQWHVIYLPIYSLSGHHYSSIAFKFNINRTRKQMQEKQSIWTLSVRMSEIGSCSATERVNNNNKTIKKGNKSQFSYLLIVATHTPIQTFPRTAYTYRMYWDQLTPLK